MNDEEMLSAGDGRITSYNVCYTKLLRDRVPADARFPAPAGLGEPLRGSLRAGRGRALALRASPRLRAPAGGHELV